MKRVILLILVLAVLVAGIWYVRKLDQADQQNMDELYSGAEPLERQKRTLEEERAKLISEYDTLLRDPSTIEILFREMNESLFIDVYPLMRDRGITGVLGLNLHEYPGQYTKLSKEQFNRLMMDGWGSCLIYEEGYNFDSWCIYMLSWLNRDEIPVPKTIYFPNNTYDPSWDEYLISIGIETILTDAQDGHSSTLTKINTLWFTGAMPWNYTGVNSDIELLSYTDGANLVFTVSFSSLWDVFEPESFTNLLDTLQNVLVVENLLEMEAIATPTPVPTGPASPTNTEFITPLISVTSFEEARDAHRTAVNSRESLIRERENRQAELDAQIAELEEQIAAIYNAWRNK